MANRSLTYILAKPEETEQAKAEAGEAQSWRSADKTWSVHVCREDLDQTGAIGDKGPPRKGCSCSGSSVGRKRPMCPLLFYRSSMSTHSCCRHWFSAPHWSLATASANKLDTCLVWHNGLPTSGLLQRNEKRSFFSLFCCTPPFSR